MTIKNLQTISIRILNSQYSFIFNILISFTIYFCFKGSFIMSAFCTNEGVPLIAEPKIPVAQANSIPSALQLEVAGFLNQASIIEDQKKEIETLTSRSDGLADTVLQLLTENDNLSMDKDQILHQKDICERQKKLIEQQRDLYKETLERTNERFMSVANDYPKAINHSYKAGRFDGVLLSTAIGFTMLGLTVLANAIKKN